MTLTIQSGAENLSQQVTTSLDEFGVVVIEGILDESILERAKRALELCTAEDESLGRLMRGSLYDPDKLNIRIINLPGRDVVFRDILELPEVRIAVSAWLGNDVRLSNFSSNTTSPGAGAMDLHVDQNNIPAPWPPYPCGLNLAFALDDFTPQNATRYIVKSHRLSQHRDSRGAHPDAIPAEAGAGSVILMDGRVQHQTGPNIGTTHRRGLFAYFIRSFLAPQFPWHRGIAPELAAELNPWLRELMGFGSAGGLKETSDAV